MLNLDDLMTRGNYASTTATTGPTLTSLPSEFIIPAARYESAAVPSGMC
jgi:hypothetical protein